jgi:hypothetical protein
MSKYPRSPETCLEAMIKWRRENTTNKQRTLDFYSETVKAAFNILEATECHMMPFASKRGKEEHKYGMIVQEDILKILAFMIEEDYAIATQQGYIRALDHYCRHYKNTAINDMNIEWPEDDRPKVDWLEEGQLAELFACPMNPRQELAVNFMGRMGLRRVECIRMKLKDLSPRYAMIRGKGHLGGKMRNVPIKPKVQVAIDRYMKYREKIIEIARAAKPDVEVPEEVFIYWNQGKLLPYEEDGWGFDKAVIVPLRKKLGFPFFESHITKNIRPPVVEGRSKTGDDRGHPRPQLDGGHDQVSRDQDGRHGRCNGSDRLTAIGE